MAMLGMPLKFLGATIVLGIFVIGPKVLSSFGITNEIVDFLILPVVVFAMLTFVICVYASNIVLNPARFMIFIPFILLLAGVLTFGLYM